MKAARWLVALAAELWDHMKWAAGMVAVALWLSWSGYQTAAGFLKVLGL